MSNHCATGYQNCSSIRYHSWMPLFCFSISPRLAALPAFALWLIFHHRSTVFTRNIHKGWCVFRWVPRYFISISFNRIKTSFETPVSFPGASAHFTDKLLGGLVLFEKLTESQLFIWKENRFIMTDFVMEKGN